jgi:hypothetical protein
VQKIKIEEKRKVRNHFISYCSGEKKRRAEIEIESNFKEVRTELIKQIEIENSSQKKQKINKFLKKDRSQMFETDKSKSIKIEESPSKEFPTPKKMINKLLFKVDTPIQKLKLKPNRSHSPTYRERNHSSSQAHKRSNRIKYSSSNTKTYNSTTRLKKTKIFKINENSQRSQKQAKTSRKSLYTKIMPHGSQKASSSRSSGKGKKKKYFSNTSFTKMKLQQIRNSFKLGKSLTKKSGLYLPESSSKSSSFLNKISENQNSIVYQTQNSGWLEEPLTANRNLMFTKKVTKNKENFVQPEKRKKKTLNEIYKMKKFRKFLKNGREKSEQLKVGTGRYFIQARSSERLNAKNEIDIRFNCNNGGKQVVQINNIVTNRGSLEGQKIRYREYRSEDKVGKFEKILQKSNTSRSGSRKRGKRNASERLRRIYSSNCRSVEDRKVREDLMKREIMRNIKRKRIAHRRLV